MKAREFIPNYNSTLGLKQANSETNMPFGCLLDVLNMNLDGLGGKSPRRGYVELFHLTDGLGGSRIHHKIQSLIQFKPTTGGTNQILAYANDSIYQKNPSGTDTSVVRTSLTADTRWDWVQYNDFIHGVNGNNTSFLYDGTTAITISITAPASHVTLTPIAGGALVIGQTYEYLVTIYDDNNARESAPYSVLTAPSSLIAGPNQTLRLSNFPSVTSGEGATHYRIYRRKTGETNFTLTATITTATATYDDAGDATGTTELNIDTGDMDEGYTAHPQSSLIEEAFDRVFMVPVDNPTLLVFSLPGGKSFAFPSGNFRPIGRNDGSPIIGLHKHGDSLLIHKRNSWWILEDDPTTTVPRRLSGVGTQDVSCSASNDNNVFRLTPKGFYFSAPTEFKANDIREDYIGRDIIEEEKLIDMSQTDDVSVVSYDGKNSSHMYAIFPNSSTLVSKVLVFDTILNEWVKYELGTDIYCVESYEQDGDTLLMMADGYGMVWTWDEGLADGVDLDHETLNGTFTSAGSTSFADTSKVDDSGTATSGGASTLTDTTKTWTVNEWTNSQLYIASGAGSGQTATILSNTANQLTISGTFSVTPDATSVYQIGGWPVNGLVGVLVTTLEGTGAEQKRRIESNTPSTAVITSAWTTTPDTSTVYAIGAIDHYGEEFWDNNGDSHIWKRMRWVLPYVRQVGQYPIEISFRRDFRRGFDNTLSRNIQLFNSESLWGVLMWGVDEWGSSTTDIQRVRIRGKYRYYSIRYRNRKAAQPFNWDGHGAIFQRLYDRNG